MSNTAPGKSFLTAFTKGRRYAIDEAGEERGHKDWWRRSTFVAYGLLAVSLIDNHLQRMQHKEIPYMYVVERGSGLVQPVGPIPPMTDPIEDTVHHYLRELITCLRWVGEDVEVLQKLWLQHQWRVTDKARSQFLAYEAQHQPTKQRNLVRVDGFQIFRRSKFTYDVRWQETTFDRLKREPLGPPVRHAGLVTFAVQPPTRPEHRQHNPAGIYFDSWQWSKE